MKKVEIDLKELRNRLVFDRDNKEIGRVREIEQELRTGRFSTLHVEVDPKHTQKTEFGRWHHLPLSTDDIEIDNSVKKSHSLESIDSVRVRTDHIEEVGAEVRLRKDVNELSREWNEITVRK